MSYWKWKTEKLKGKWIKIILWFRFFMEKLFSGTKFICIGKEWFCNFPDCHPLLPCCPSPTVLSGGFQQTHTGSLGHNGIKSCRTGRFGDQFPTSQVVLFGSIHITFSVFYVEKTSWYCRGREHDKTSDYTSITFIAARAGSRTQMIDNAMVLFNNEVDA